MPLNGLQVKEMFLTAAQSMLGVTILASFGLSIGGAVLLFVLFTAQLMTQLLPEVMPHVFTGVPTFVLVAGYVFAYGYLALSLAWPVFSRDSRAGLASLLGLSSFGGNGRVRG